MRVGYMPFRRTEGASRASWSSFLYSFSRPAEEWCALKMRNRVGERNIILAALTLLLIGVPKIVCGGTDETRELSHAPRCLWRETLQIPSNIGLENLNLLTLRQSSTPTWRGDEPDPWALRDEFWPGNAAPHDTNTNNKGLPLRIASPTSRATRRTMRAVDTSLGRRSSSLGARIVANMEGPYVTPIQPLF